MVQVPNEEKDLEFDDNLQEIPPPKNLRLNYDRMRRFQNEWSAKFV